MGKIKWVKPKKLSDFETLPEIPRTPRHRMKYACSMEGPLTEPKCADCPYYPGSEYPKEPKTFSDYMEILFCLAFLGIPSLVFIAWLIKHMVIE